MKNHNNNRKLYWMLPLVAVLIGFGCKKEPKDYRSQYVGNWEFTVNKTKFDNSIGMESEPTIVYPGRVRTVDDRKLKFNYTAGDSIVLEIDEAGKFSEFPTPYCTGNFTDPSKLYLYLRWGGLGIGGWHEINAIKK